MEGDIRDVVPNDVYAADGPVDCIREDREGTVQRPVRCEPVGMPEDCADLVQVFDQGIVKDGPTVIEDRLVLKRVGKNEYRRERYEPSRVRERTLRRGAE